MTNFSNLGTTNCGTTFNRKLFNRVLSAKDALGDVSEHAEKWRIVPISRLVNWGGVRYAGADCIDQQHDCIDLRVA